jgi:hypothetical protein
MKRFALAIALACVLSGTALAGDIPSTGAPAPGDIPSTGAPSPALAGDIPSTGAPSPIVTVILTILSLVR